MRRSALLLTVLGLTLAGTLQCSPTSDVHYACNADGGCFDGMRCILGHCYAPGEDAGISSDAGVTDAGTTDGGCGVTEGQETSCADGVDNDCDGRTDCEDSACEFQLCRASVGDCDIFETCESGVCPPDRVHTAAIVCRLSQGACDPVELCPGDAGICPPDALSPNGAKCRDAQELCDVPENCNGTSASCPTDEFLPSTFVCRPAVSTTCDFEERCTGTSAACPDDVTQCAAGQVCCNPQGCAADCGD